jgi:hypothetical protein
MRWWPPLLHLIVMALLLPLAVLRVGAAIETPPPPGEMRPAEAGEAAEAVGGVVVPVAGSPVDLEALAARPLFVPGRLGEAGEAESAPVVAEPDRGGRLRMVGYLDDGTKPRAILELEGSGAVATVREGESFEGFEVRQITRDAVIVTDQGEEITVKMFDQ